MNDAWAIKVLTKMRDDRTGNPALSVERQALSWAVPRLVKRRLAKQVFIHSERDAARMRREDAAWASGATATEAERAYYGRKT